MPIAHCESCPFAGSISREHARTGVVECDRSLSLSLSNTNESRFAPAVAAALPVGLALTQEVLCVQDNLSWANLGRVAELARHASSVAVVNDEDELVGVLPPAAIAFASQDGPVDGLASVATLAESAVSVHEASSLGDAFSRMGACHLRELTVVGDGLEVVGLLRDIDALRVVAQFVRTGERMTPEAPCARASNGQPTR